MSRIRSLLAQAWMDVVLGAAGLAFGLGSLSYPFGRDQGLYFYVAREWVVRGAIPYRDVLDHKTPGIYFLYALAVRLFGETMWGIRVFDLLCVAAVGFVAAELTAARGERVRPGTRGAALFAASVLYYGYLNFWDTAQSELWYSMFAVAGAAAAHRIQRDSRAAVVAGLLGGSALIMKPPAMWMVFVAASWLMRRAWIGSPKESSRAVRLKAVVRAMFFFGVGGAIVPGLIGAYFGAKGAIPAMLDIVVGANSYYVKHERGTETARDSLRAISVYHWCYFPLVIAILSYVVVPLIRARRSKNTSSVERHALALFVTAGAYLAVIMQGKYYLLHWTVAIPAFVVIVANAYRSLSERLEKRPAWILPLTYVGTLTALWLGALVSWRGPEMWWLSTRNAYRWSTGQSSRDEFTWHFQLPPIEFWYWTSEKVGFWLRDHTTPEDFVAVRGFEPQIYAISGRRHAGRFFWTTFITNPKRAYRREEWLKEDLDALKRTPPKYVVALTNIPEGPDSVRYFEPLGYRTVEVMWEFTIMERVPPTAEHSGL